MTPNFKESNVVKVDETALDVRMDERAADRRLLEMLSEHFGVPKSRMAIVRGAKSKDKIIEVAARQSVQGASNSVKLGGNEGRP